MERLPTEILHQICEHLADDKSLLKGIRLVSHRCSEVAAGQLFRNVLLYLHPESWGKLNQIAGQPMLARQVNGITLAVTKPLPAFKNLKEWDLETRNFRDIMGDVHGYPIAKPGCQYWRRCRAELRSNYDYYKSWHAGETRLLRAQHLGGAAVPQLAFQSLLNLQTVETKNQYLLHGHVDSHPSELTTREQETLVPSWLCRSEDTTHLEMFLSAARAAAFDIPVLKLHSVFELFTEMLPLSLNIAQDLGELVLDTSVIPGDLQELDINRNVTLFRHGI